MVCSGEPDLGRWSAHECAASTFFSVWRAHVRATLTQSGAWRALMRATLAHLGARCSEIARPGDGRRVLPSGDPQRGTQGDDHRNQVQRRAYWLPE